MEIVTHNGGYSTITDFKLESGDHVRIEVWLTTECTVASRGTYYNCNLLTRGKGCRNWYFKFKSIYCDDRRIFNFITEQQLYTAYFNHWAKLNPIRIFNDGSINGEYVNFTVDEKPQQTRHFAF